MKYHGFILAAGATLALAACGGSSGGGGSADVSLPAQFADLEAVVAAGEAGNLAEAPANMLAGTASLSGGFGVGDLGDDQNLELLGDMSLSADFDQGRLTGSAENFALYDQDSNEAVDDISGSLTIAGNIAGATINADASGVLSDNEDHAVEMAMDGSFYQYDGNLVAYGDTAGTIDGEQYEGGFAAVRD